MSEYLKVITKTWHLNEKLEENTVHSKSQNITLYDNFVLKVRQTDSYSLENPRTSNFPKLIYANKAIVHGESWAVVQ